MLVTHFTFKVDSVPNLITPNKRHNIWIKKMFEFAQRPVGSLSISLEPDGADYRALSLSGCWIANKVLRAELCETQTTGALMIMGLHTICSVSLCPFMIKIRPDSPSFLLRAVCARGLWQIIHVRCAFVQIHNGHVPRKSQQGEVETIANKSEKCWKHKIE